MARVVKRYLVENKQNAETKRTVMKVGIYSRLSVDNDERKGESIENQIELINQYIITNNKKTDRSVEYVPYDTYIDRGKTGTNFNRAGFERLMQDIRMKNVDCIMVKDFSRFGRDYIETGNYIEKILPFMGVRFISVADNFDSMSDNAVNEKLAMNIKNLVNDMYAKDISQRITMSKRNAMEKGEYIGTVPPYGYKVERVNGKRTLIVDKKAAVIVRLIFELHGSGLSAVEISKNLYEKKIHRITEYRIYGTVYHEENQILYQWTDSSLHAMLKNEAYIGNLVQGKVYNKTYTGDTKQKNNPEEKWVRIENTHEAIIDVLLFPEQREKRQSDNVSKDLIKEIFHDKVYCGDCGKKLKTSIYSSEKNLTKQYLYYCRWAYSVDHRKCTKKTIRKKQLELLLLTAIQNEFGHLNLKAKDITAINEGVKEEKKSQYNQEKNNLDKRLNIERQNLAHIFMEYKEGAYTKNQYEVIRKQGVENEKFIFTCISDLDKKMMKLDRRAEEENKFLRSLFKIKKQGVNAELIDTLVEKIDVYSTGKVVIYFRFKGGDFNAK